jgi:hypothetical protein
MSMLVRVLEVGLFALIGLVLLAPFLRRAGRKVWPAPVALSGAGEAKRSTAEHDEVRRRWAGRLGGVLFVIAIINFLAFSLHTGSLGGSAFTGQRVVGWNSVSAGGQQYTEGNGPAPVRAEGRYYVSSHGRYTQVTEQQWRAVRAHEITVYVTHPLCLLVGGALLAYSQRWWGRQRQAAPGAAPDAGRV